MNQSLAKGSLFSIDHEPGKLIASIQIGGICLNYDCSTLCCDNPVCNCGILYIEFLPRGHEDTVDATSPITVDFDVVGKTVGYKDKKKVPKEQLEFAKLLSARMDDQDFQLLGKYYLAYKKEQTESAALDEIEVEFDYAGVENEGMMYAYKDVLPYGDHLAVSFNGESCVFLDQYCLVPKCSCTDVYLTFFQENASEEPVQELFTVGLNYTNNKWSTVNRGAVPVDLKAVRSAVEEQFPDIRQRLRRRHQKLKTIYAHCKKRDLKQPLDLPKVGRNDPCPCGSGKKFKKCCGK